MSYQRTEKHRQLQAQLIKKWRPWEQSTGAKTETGKANVSQNALKHGVRSKKIANQLKDIKELLAKLSSK